MPNSDLKLKLDGRFPMSNLMKHISRELLHKIDPDLPVSGTEMAIITDYNSRCAGL